MYGSEERNEENGSDVWLHKSKLITSSNYQKNKTSKEDNVFYNWLHLPSLFTNSAVMATSF